MVSIFWKFQKIAMAKDDYNSIILLFHVNLGEEQTPTLEYKPPETQPCLLSPHLQTGLDT